jgi:hypothetical protein
MAMFNQDCLLASACLKAGDWRGAICWLEDAKDRAEKLGMHGRARTHIWPRSNSRFAASPTNSA